MALALLTLLLCAMNAAPALGAQAWRIDSFSNSTIAPGATSGYLVQITNVGDAAMDGTEIDLTGTLPPGLTAVDARLLLDPSGDATNVVSCTAGDGVSPVAGASDVRCVSSTPLQGVVGGPNGNYQLLQLDVRADPAASGTLTSSFAVVGGGAPAEADTVDPVRISGVAPAFGIDAFDGQVVDPAGRPLTQAGGHPADASVSVDFDTFTKGVPLGGVGWPVEPIKDVLVDLPPGLVGDPTGVDQCTAAQLAGSGGLETRTLCPATAQVGTILVRMNNSPFSPPIYGPLPVYNLVPPPNAPARFGFKLAGTVVVLDAKVRSGGDYGISIDSRNIAEAVPIAGVSFTFWGVPSAPAHDAERSCFNSPPPAFGGPSCTSGAASSAFLRNPTSCSPPAVGLPTVVHVDSWFNPGAFQSATFFSHLPPAYPAPVSDQGVQIGPTGCDRVPFDPKLEGQPVSTKFNSPSGFAFDLSLPQTDDPDLVAESDLETAVVTLPEGVRVNPSAADGLQACTPAQIHLHDADAPNCPDASKVGSATISTPLLRDPLQGEIYLASPHDNPFGTLLSIYLVGQGSGVVIKLAGRVDADPVTGRLTATFDDNPQTPFDNLHLQFDGGPRAQLVTPRQCGPSTTHAQLTGWNGRVVETDSTFTVSGDGNGAPCPPRKFTPGFSAGSKSNRGGESSPLSIRLTRDDADEEISTFDVQQLPFGLIGRIADVTLCSDADAQRGVCGDGSKIGSVTVGAGAGSNPFYITDGRVYLTGPYKGAPFGLSIVVPAKAGPFDLGNVVVRSAIFVDRHTSQLRVATDPLPTILQGIPLQVRDVRVAIDRPGFIINPTNCSEMAIKGTVGSTGGLTAAVSDRYQAADCGALGFKPRMVLKVGGAGHTARNRTTPLSTRITMPTGNANLRFVRVTLPQTINARLTVINDACTRTEFDTNIAKCAHAQAGSATAVTPVLREPLRGGVYFVRNGHPLPDLFVALRGQVNFDLIGRVTIPGSKRLATTFDAPPDVPIRSFTLRLFGDKQNGSVGAAANLCAAKSRKQKAELDYIGQNGKVLQVDQRLQVGGCAKPHKHKAKKAARHHRRG
jgi:hypothetical protein